MSRVTEKGHISEAQCIEVREEKQLKTFAQLRYDRISLALSPPERSRFKNDLMRAFRCGKHL